MKFMTHILGPKESVQRLWFELSSKDASNSVVGFRRVTDMGPNGSLWVQDLLEVRLVCHSHFTVLLFLGFYCQTLSSVISLVVSL